MGCLSSSPAGDLLTVTVRSEDRRGRTTAMTFRTHAPPIEMTALRPEDGALVRWAHLELGVPQQGTIRVWNQSSACRGGESARQVGGSAVAVVSRTDLSSMQGTALASFTALLTEPDARRLGADSVMVEAAGVEGVLDLIPDLQGSAGVIRCPRFVPCAEVEFAAGGGGAVRVVWSDGETHVLANIKFVDHPLPLRAAGRLTHSRGLAFLDAFRDGLSTLIHAHDMLPMVDATSVPAVEVRTLSPQGFCVTDISPETLGWDKRSGRMVLTRARARFASPQYMPHGVERVAAAAALRPLREGVVAPPLDCDLWTSPMDADALFLSMCCAVAHSDLSRHERPTIVSRCAERLSKGALPAVDSLVREVDEWLRARVEESLRDWDPFAQTAREDAFVRSARYLPALRKLIGRRVKAIEDAAMPDVAKARGEVADAWKEEALEAKDRRKEKVEMTRRVAAQLGKGVAKNMM